MTDRLTHALNYQPRYREFIYFIKCQSFVKIGRARDVMARVQLLQIGNPHKLKLLGCFGSDNVKDEERQIHAELLRYHRRGEWFEVPATVLKPYIDRCKGRLWTGGQAQLPMFIASN